jgi:hypothetical protein
VRLTADPGAQPSGACLALNGGFWQTAEFISVEPGRRYSFAAWFRGERQGAITTVAYLRVFYFDAANQAVRTAALPNYPYDEIEDRGGAGATDWRRVELAFQVPAGATKLRLAVYPGSVVAPASCPAGGVSGWYDDLVLTPL